MIQALKSLIQPPPQDPSPQEPLEDEYISDIDHLIYCKKCHTPRQKRFDHPIFGDKDTLPVPCQCQARDMLVQEEQEAQQKHEQVIRRLRGQGLRDPKMLAWTFENDTTNCKQITMGKRYVAQFDQIRQDNVGMLFWGNVGTGKSFVAGCIANALIDKEVSVCMTNFGVILADMTNLKIDKNEYMRNLNRNSLLIIDDFGMERDTLFALEQIYNVIDSRYTACKPLIVTTNLTLAELQNKNIQTDYQRIYDRVLEMCVPVLFEGESKRKHKADEKRNKLREILG